MAVSSMKTSRRTVAAMVDLTVIVGCRRDRSNPQSRHGIVTAMVGGGR